MKKPNPVGLYNTITEQFSIEKLREIFPKVYLDPKFQRYGGPSNGSGWSITNCENFLRSVCEQTLTNKIEFADVEFNLLHLKSDNDAHAKRAKEYYKQRQKDDKELVSIDGFNTHSSIYYFISTEQQIRDEMGDEFVRFKLKVRDPNDGKMKYFEEFDTDQKREILNFKLSVYRHERILVDQMKKQFRKLNQSTKLNDQESRNCEDTDLADGIREYGAKKNVKDFFTHYFNWGKTNFDRRQQEETLARIYNWNDGELNLKKQGLDTLYHKTKILDKSIFDNIFAHLDLFTPVISQCSAKRGRKIGEFFAFLSFLEAVDRDSEYQFHNNHFERVFDWFEKTHNLEAKSAKKKYTQEEVCLSYSHWVENYTLVENYTKIKAHWLGGPNVIRRDEDGKVIKSEPAANLYHTHRPDLIAKGFIVKIQKSQPKQTRQRPTEAMMKELAELQGWKTRYGEEITMTDIRSPNVLHTAHLISHVNGGPFELHNLELQFKADNLKNATKEMEPFFDFQKVKI